MTSADPPVSPYSPSFFTSETPAGLAACLLQSLGFFTAGISAVQTALPSSQPQLLHCRNSSCSSCLSFFTASASSLQKVQLFQLPLLFHSLSFFTQKLQLFQLLSSMPKLLHCWNLGCSILLYSFSFFTSESPAVSAASPFSQPQLLHFRISSRFSCLSFFTASASSLQKPQLFQLSHLLHSLSFFTSETPAVPAVSPSSQPQLLHSETPAVPAAFFKA